MAHKLLWSLTNNHSNHSVRSKRKPLARIERILLNHQDINHCVIWKKGKENLADFISRHAIPLHKLPQRIAKEIKEHQKTTVPITQYTPLLNCYHQRMLTWSTTQRHKSNTTTWLHSYQLTPIQWTTEREYYRLFSELSIENDVIHRGDQMLLPKSLQQEAISLAHEGSHPG